MDDVTWAALTLVLTLLAGGYTWYAFRNGRTVAGIRGVAVTLLPPAAYLTGTLEAGTRIADALVDWGTGLVFGPSVWFGLLLLGASATLFFLANLIGSRRTDDGEPASERKLKKAPSPELNAPPPGRGKPVIDDDLAEIEAILKKRGIS